MLAPAAYLLTLTRRRVDRKALSEQRMSIFLSVVFVFTEATFQLT